MSFFNNFLKKSQEAPPQAKSLKLFTFLKNDKSASTKYKRLAHILHNIKHKATRNTLDCLSYAFIKLCLWNRRAILLKIIFEKIKIILFAKNHEFFSLFIFQISGKTLSNTKKPENFTITLDIDNVSNSIDSLHFNRIKKIVNDISGDKGNGIEKRLVFHEIKLIISLKYAVKILKLFFYNKRNQQLSNGFSKIMTVEGGIISRSPDILKRMALKNEQENNEFQQFLSNEKPIEKSNKKTSIMSLHCKQLKDVTAKNPKNKDMSLKLRENLILSNWAGHQLNRILRYYHKEYLMLGFNQILKVYHKAKYRHKVLVNLYEKYRCSRIMHVFHSFLVWKMKCFDQKRFFNVNLLILRVDVLKRKVMRGAFLRILFRIFQRDKNSNDFNKKTINFKAGVILQRFFEKKRVFLLESVFSRIRHEKYLIELANKLNAIDKIDVFYKRKVMSLGVAALRNYQKNMRDYKKLIKVLKYIIKIRKIICFYKIYGFAEFSIKK